MPFIQRHIQTRISQALLANSVVFLNGPRQAGKSTLVQHISKESYPADYVTMDSPIQMAAAASAPEAFLTEREGNLIIDEVQLVPELFRALKSVTDNIRLNDPDNAKGRFLLTGSANIMALPKLADPLVGRMGVLTLFPLSGSEVLGGQGDFIDCLFEREFKSDAKVKLPDLMKTITQATYPEVSDYDDQARSQWFDGYLTTILQRDVRALAEIEKLSIMPNLLRILAARAGGLVNDADIARDAGLNPMTTRNYKTLLRMLFLTFDVPPWFRNIGKRLVKSPKGYMVDTMLLCYLLQYDLERLETNRPELFGNVIENFVATELIKLISSSGARLGLFHFRTSDQKEVDFVLEKPSGELAAIEVKSRGQVSSDDFKGLKELQRLTGEDFQCGVVLYRGKDIVPFGERLWAIPMTQICS